MLSHTRMDVPYEYTHMGRPIRVWANIRIWGEQNHSTSHFVIYYADNLAKICQTSKFPSIQYAKQKQFWAIKRALPSKVESML